MTPKQKMLKYMEDKSKYNSGYFGWVISFPGQSTPEIVVNFGSAIKENISYFANSYTDDLCLISDPEFRILNYGWKVDFEDLEKLLEENGGIN